MLFLRGLWWRRGFSAAVLIVGVISAAVAAIGPLYARAAAESTLTDELTTAGSDAGLAFTLVRAANEPSVIENVDARIGAGEHVPGYGAPIHGMSTLVTARAAGNGASTATTMVWRQGLCPHVILTSGRCPRTVGEALVPLQTTLAGQRWVDNTPLTVRLAGTSHDRAATVIDLQVIGRVRVVGSYRPRDTADPYWFGLPYFRGQLGPSVQSAITNGGADAVFVERAQFSTVPGDVQANIAVDVPLVPRKVRLDGVASLRGDVAAVQRRFPTVTKNRLNAAMRTSLPHVLADAVRDKRQVDTATLVVVLELAALSLLVLFQVVNGAVEARGNEIALAKLRGLRPRRTVLFALGEPFSLLVLSLPLGLLVALGVAHLMAGTALVDGTPVALTSSTGWVLAAAFAGSVLAAALGAARTVTRPVLEQWRSTSPARHGARLLLALDLGLAALAVATVISLRARSDRPQAVFLLAPALIVFAVALVGVRLLPRTGRRGLARTRSSRRLAAFLALRQTVRRPGGLRLAALLAVSVGLATFAVCGEAVAQANRAARAQTEIGAVRQLSAQFVTGHDPQSAVAAADPHGRWAMAAATWTADGGPANGHTITGRLLGVEPSRFAAAGFAVRGQLRPGQIAAEVDSPANRPATFRGNSVRITLDTLRVSGDRPLVRINLRDRHANVTEVDATNLLLGTHSYVARADCAAGCAFAGVTIDRTAYAQDLVTGSTVLRSVEAGDGASFRPVPVQLTTAQAWRGQEVGVGATLHASNVAEGIRADFRSTGGSVPVLGYADTPAVLPVVASRNAVTSPEPGAIADYSGTLVGYKLTRIASPLPATLDTGAIANLDYLRIRFPNFEGESDWSVWLGPKAPPDAVARLERAGLLVQHQTTEGARVAVLARQGPALGLLLLLVCAIAAAVLAIGGTAVALLADARRRSFELAALHVVGVSHRTLRHSAVLEQALLLGAAIVLGLPSGYFAAVLVLPVVPEFADPTPVVLQYVPPVLIALACAAGFAILLCLTALIAGRALARSAVPARLREAAR